MVVDTTGAQWVRGLVKTIFVLCYIAFMWASIHHVATYFDNFEASSDPIGSYALAGAFDITALVTTIGVMFFRKSMPTWVLVIVWGFILAIAAYSFFINWEYASHYQSMSLIMQPTGATIPVYDPQGMLRYVPEMRANTSLIWINPILASGFTIFSLVYSIIAEFFGTKLPTASELVERKKYLEETAGLLDEIRTLEQKGKKPSLIQRTKEVVKEVKSAANEIRNEGSIADVSSDYADDSVPEMEEEPFEDEDDHQDEREDGHEQHPAQKRASLGMIEGMMYDAVMKNKTILIEVLQEANMSTISDLTLSLQRRFSDHAHFLSESRVQIVFDAIQADYPELISSSKVPETNPEMEPISPAYEEQRSELHTDDLPTNVTDISNAKKTRSEKNGPSHPVNTTLANGTDMSARRGAYAITKEAASEVLRCPISEIERGVSEGRIKPFAKDPEKVLRSSLEDFVPRKRTRKAAKKTVKLVGN